LRLQEALPDLTDEQISALFSGNLARTARLTFSPLGETGDGNLKASLVPYPADQMRMWEISPRVNSPKNDDPSLWEPLNSQPTQPTTDGLELLRE